MFRLLVGEALAERDTLTSHSWGRKKVDPATRAAEIDHEKRVSVYLGAMRVLWLEIDDAAGKGSLRGVVERNVIGLLSNYHRSPIDPPSPTWVGRSAKSEKVRESGLWNQDYVETGYEPAFLGTFENLVLAMRERA